jgi:hypothetical protein
VSELRDRAEARIKSASGAASYDAVGPLANALATLYVGEQLERIADCLEAADPRTQGNIHTVLGDIVVGIDRASRRPHR